MRMAWGIIAAALTLSPLMAEEHEAQARRAAQQQVFRTTIENLDLGGDLLLFVNTEDIARSLVGGLAELVAMIAEQEPDATEPAAVLQRINGFMEKTGMYDLRAMGMSSILRDDGQYDVKSFLSRAPTDETPMFWKMFGGAPRQLESPGMIPASAEVVMVSECAMQDLWAFIRGGIREVGGEEVHAQVEEMIAGMKEEGIDVEKVVASLGDEIAIALTLHGKRTMELPVADGTASIPEPGLLVALKTTDDTLHKLLLHACIQMEIPLKQVEVAEGVVHVFPENPDAPFTLQPAMITADGYLLLASSPQILGSALQAGRAKNGFMARPDIAAAMKDMPAAVNAFSFASDRFYEVMLDIQKTAMDDQHTSVTESALMERIMQWNKAGATLSYRVNRDEGMFSHTISPQSGRQVLLTMVAAPVGLVAGIAAPAIMMAQSKAEMMHMEPFDDMHEIHNQEQMHLVQILGQVNAAKEQWVLESGARPSDKVTEADLAPYLRDGLPLIPDGGTYIFGTAADPIAILSPDGEVFRIDW